jgi:acetyltransferase-like isoleucine patch superfamily enzyme
VYPQKEWKNPRLTIGEGCEIGHLNHITCVNQVRIGAKVLTADRVHISDNHHEFADITLPILEQGVSSRGPVEIGDGTWLGEGVNVLSCRIGRNCVIGANSVVLSDIPDFCVAVGTPARVIKRYDKEKKQWIRVNG